MPTRALGSAMGRRPLEPNGRSVSTGALGMRKLVFTFIGALALAAASRPAAAADIPVYGYGGPPSIVIFTWTGFYFGAHAGGGWGSKDIDALDPKSTRLDSSHP